MVSMTVIVKAVRLAYDRLEKGNVEDVEIVL